MIRPVAGWVLGALLLACAPARAQAPAAETPVPAAQAREHIGEVALVCGVVADTHYAQASTGRPTYINFEEPFPNAPFTAIIWGSDLGSFPYDPAMLLGMEICVYGEVGRYRGKPQMKLVRPEQVGRKQ
jgi:hypothetical protein